MEVALGAFDEENKARADSDENIYSRPAKTALEYLRQVQREAALCPDVVVAQKYASKFKETALNQSYQIKSGLTPSPQEFLPNLDWQHEQASRFAEIRQSLNHYKASIDYTTSSASHIELPEITCEDHWCKFCLGEQQYKEVKRRARGQGNNNSKKKDETEGSDQQTQTIEGNEPLLSIVTRMRQCAIIDVLEYNVRWMQLIGFSERQGRWMYALMACLEKPLLPNVSSLLRELARRCADLRASLVKKLSEQNYNPMRQAVKPDKKDPRLPALNLIITIVTRYFDQTDLADKS